MKACLLLVGSGTVYQLLLQKKNTVPIEKKSQGLIHSKPQKSYTHEKPIFQFFSNYFFLTTLFSRILVKYPSRFEMGFNSKLRFGIDLSRAKRAEGPSRDSENMEVFRALGVQVAQWVQGA